MKVIYILVMVLSIHLTAIAQQNIRALDFKNFTYPAYCLSDEPENVTVKNGEFFKETQMEDYVDRFYFNVFGIEYGDLTGDGNDEAIILTVCNTGGTGNFSEGYIYSMHNAGPKLITRIPGGDRAYGGLRTAKAENGFLIVESNDVGETGGSCCPEFVVTTRYKVIGDKIVEAGKPTRRNLWPTDRVEFTKGSTGKTFNTTVRGGELRRFVVGARAGQSLMVSTDSAKVSLSLVEDARVTEGINNFTAKLPISGDYTIVVQNLADDDQTVTMNIKIN